MYGRPQRALSYAKYNDQDKKYCVLKDIHQLDLTLNTTGFYNLSISDLRNCPGMTRVTNLYSKIKVLKMSVKFFQEKGIHMDSRIFNGVTR